MSWNESGGRGLLETSKHFLGSRKNRTGILRDGVSAEKVPFLLKSHLSDPKSRLFGLKSQLFSSKVPFQYHTFL
jgi:hypothetical protein